MQDLSLFTQTIDYDYYPQKRVAGRTNSLWLAAIQKPEVRVAYKSTSMPSFVIFCI